MTPYVCAGTIVRTTTREGKVLGVDPINKIAVVFTGTTYFTVPTAEIKIVSYGEVE